MKSLEERIKERLLKDLFAYSGYSYSEGHRPVYGEEVAEGKFTVVDVTKVKRGDATARYVVGKPRAIYSKNILRKVYSELDVVNAILRQLEKISKGKKGR